MRVLPKAISGKPETEFENKVFNMVENDREKYYQKNKQLVKWAKNVLRKMFDKKDEFSEIKFNPATYQVMEMLHNNKLSVEMVKSMGCTLWNQKSLQPLWHYLIYRDNTDELQYFVYNRHATRKFLDKFRDKLRTNYQALYNELCDEIIDIQRDKIYIKYSHEFVNTQDHIDVLMSGKLTVRSEQPENVFGMTPFDYLVNQLLEQHSRHAKDINLELLQNLRKSLADFRQSNIKLAVSNNITKEQIANLESVLEWYKIID